MPVYNSILETIGNTPVIRLEKLSPQGINLFVKVEAFNPMGSVKDRLALGLIEDAERRGELTPGQTVIEATSGNTGIGLAMVCARKGYPLVVTMAENFSTERRKMMRFLGAKVVLTPAAEKGSGMLAKAEELAEKHGWWLARQFENPANAEVHANTTALEILDDFSDKGLDYWVTGYGTAGTLNGVSRVLKTRSPSTRIVVCEPDNSQVLGSGIPQQRDAEGRHSGSHPNFRPHLMQGWSPDFVPRLAEQVLDEDRIDEFMPIDGQAALQCAMDLACKEGIFVGISAGATLAGALTIARRATEGSNILCMLPDTGERYLSTPLFENIASEMTPEEVELSRSTPGYRFDAPQSPGQTQGQISLPEATDSAREYVAQVVSSEEQPVVMFALEWCEFCWSLRKLFARCGIAYRSVDLDSVAFQKDGWGSDIRAALSEKTGCVTIPQVFVGGKFIGGCSETFDSYRDNSLQTALDSLGVEFTHEPGLDPYQLLPSWLQPR